MSNSMVLKIEIMDKGFMNEWIVCGTLEGVVIYGILFLLWVLILLLLLLLLFLLYFLMIS
jgi:hypothetical protein